MKRILVGFAVVAVVFAAVLPRASAMVATDPWVPPSVGTHDGLAPAGLAIGGASMPLASSGRDVVYVAEGGWYCTSRIDPLLMGWSAGVLTVPLTIVAGGGNYADGCVYNRAWGGSVMFECLVTASTASEYPVGSMFQRSQAGVSMSWTGSGYSFSGFDCSQGGGVTVVVAWVSGALQGGSMAEDGFLSFNPEAPTFAVTITTTCSDSSTVSASFAAGAPVSAPACVTGDFVSAVVTAAGAAVGHVGIAAPFRGNPCLAGVGLCQLMVTSVGVTCANDDPTCAWWNGTAAADACGWKDGAGEMFSLAATDCEAARHDGFDVPGGFSTGSPTPTPTPSPTETSTPVPSGGSTTINVNVTVTPVQPANNPAGGCLDQVSIWSPTSFVLEPLRCAFIPSKHRFGGVADSIVLCHQTPDFPHIQCSVEQLSGWCPVEYVPDAMQEMVNGHWIEKCVDGPWSDWQRSFNQFINAFTPGAGSACEGPSYNLPMIHRGGHGLTLANDFVIHPFQACVEPGLTFAAMSTVCLRAIMMVGAFLASWDTIRRLVKA